MSRPSRARELKLGVRHDQRQPRHQSRPSRARELKLDFPEQSNSSDLSRPSRARELKQDPARVRGIPELVAPLAGA